MHKLQLGCLKTMRRLGSELRVLAGPAAVVAVGAWIGTRGVQVGGRGRIWKSKDGLLAS